MSVLPVRPARPTAEAREAREARTRPVRRPVLEVVAAPTPVRSLVPYVMLLVSILLAAMVGALVLNTSMAQTSFDIQSRQVELQQLQQRAASLQAQVDTAGSPAALQTAATALGMVPADDIGHLSLAERTILSDANQ